MPLPTIPQPLGVYPEREPVWGISGTALMNHVTYGGRTQVFYVDPSHPLADDNNDGTDPDAPLFSISGIVARTLALNAGTGTRQPALNSYDTICLCSSTTESVSITDYTTMASYVTVIGIGPNRFSPTWTSAANTTPCIIAGAVGWRFTGIQFAVPTTSAAVVVPCTQAPYGANAIGIRTIIDNCYFYGATTGLYGIDLHGAPYNVEIRDCYFAFIQNGANTSHCIVSTNTGYADAYRTVIEGCWFHECDNFIDASLNVSLIQNNIFSGFGAYDAIVYIDLRGGTQGENRVIGNSFGDADYSNAGGFYANAANPGSWVGNTSQDIAEAEVADNGWTIAPPA